MFMHNKNLMYTVRVSEPDPQLASLIVLTSLAVAKNSHSSSPAGTLATANFIRSDKNPAIAPTAAEVDAASTK